MKMLQRVWRVVHRPVFVLVLCFSSVVLVEASPHVGAVVETPILPRLMGVQAEYPLQRIPAEVYAAKVQAVLPTTPSDELNSSMRSYADAKIAAFRAAVPEGPVYDGFWHQLRIVPHVTYATNTAASITLQIDTYHPLNDVASEYASWVWDGTSVRAASLDEQLARDLAPKFNIDTQQLLTAVGQPIAYSVMPDATLKIYKSGPFYNSIANTYKVVDLYQLPSLARYKATFFPGYPTQLTSQMRAVFAQLMQKIAAKKLKEAPNCELQSCIALTFDDGPHPDTTPQVMEILKSRQVTATFFVLGSEVQKHPDIAKKLISSGFELENHSFGHPDFVKLHNPDRMMQEIDATQAILRSVGANPRYFRPPYGSVNNVVRSVVQMPFIFWNVDAQEWRTGSATETARSIVAQARPGAIVLMHDTKQLTIEALPRIVDELQARGFRLVSVADLLSLDANSRGDYRAR